MDTLIPSTHLISMVLHRITPHRCRYTISMPTRVAPHLLTTNMIKIQCTPHLIAIPRMNSSTHRLTWHGLWMGTMVQITTIVEMAITSVNLVQAANIIISSSTGTPCLPALKLAHTIRSVQARIAIVVVAWRMMLPSSQQLPTGEQHQGHGPASETRTWSCTNRRVMGIRISNSGLDMGEISLDGSSFLHNKVMEGRAAAVVMMTTIHHTRCDFFLLIFALRFRSFST